MGALSDDGGRRRALENLAGSGQAGITQHNPLVLPWTSRLVFLGRGYLLSPPGIESDRRFCRGPVIAAATGVSVSILSHSLSQFAVCIPLSNDMMEPLFKRIPQTGFETRFPRAG